MNNLEWMNRVADAEFDLFRADQERLHGTLSCVDRYCGILIANRKIDPS